MNHGMRQSRGTLAWVLTVSGALACACSIAACGADPTTDASRSRTSGPTAGADAKPIADAGALNPPKPKPKPTVADRDGDSITNADERDLDSDGDGMTNADDEDSDGDGISDADEAGDNDLSTPPVDTDKDREPDFLDLDSDNDGLPDASEKKRGSDPREVDTDGDGTDDLTEVAAGTDLLDKKKNPTADGNFFFRVAYQKPPEPERGSLVFVPQIRAADVYFMIDSSVSMASVINAVKTNLGTTIMPGIKTAIADAQIGAGEFDNCPENLSGNKVGIHHLAGTTADAATVVTGMAAINTKLGPSEPYPQAAWLFATGDVSPWGGVLPAPNCGPGRIGFGCVRQEAVPILVIVGDEPYSEGAKCAFVPTVAEISKALNDIGAKLVVLGPSGTSPEWTQIANMTGSVDAAGAPFFFSTANLQALSDATMAGPQVVSAVQKLVAEAPLSVRAVARDDDTDAFDAMEFIDRIEANTKGGVQDPRDPSVICVPGLKTADTDGDGVDETFLDVKPLTPVCFDIVAKQNDVREPGDKPEVLKAHVDVVSGNGSVLDTRDVFFLIPPRAPTFKDPIVF